MLMEAIIRRSFLPFIFPYVIRLLAMKANEKQHEKPKILGMEGYYLSLFRKEAHAKQEDVLAWLPIAAAGRLRKNLDEIERASLMETIKSTLC
jgi:hypothetical protein